jgi:xylitol oxidase
MLNVSVLRSEKVERTNWSGNIDYGAARFHEPRSLEELQQIVHGSRRIKALGSCHSFNSIADTDGDLVSMRSLQRPLSLDRENSTVTVAAGATYGGLFEPLHREGFALKNLAALPHISVGGAIATATHGSGDGNRNLSSSVAAIEFVSADGELVRLSREDGERFRGAVVHLGAIGLLTRVTLDVVPTFDVVQHVYRRLEHAALEANFDAILATAFSVSVFTNWRDPRFTQVWLKSRVGAAEALPTGDFFGASPADRNVHPVITEEATCCTPQMGSVGPWYERLLHFKMGFQPSTPSELQTEYFVPRRHGVAALHELHGLRDELAPVLQISEIRTVKADDLWMSTAYGEDRVAFHFTWRKDWPGVARVLPMIERCLTPYEVLPHWGKLTTMPAATLQAHCPRLQEFRRLAAEYDPEGVFRNDYLNTYVFEELL